MAPRNNCPDTTVTNNFISANDDPRTLKKLVPAVQWTSRSGLSVLYSTLLYSTLLYSTLLHFSLLYSTALPHYFSISVSLFLSLLSPPLPPSLFLFLTISLQTQATDVRERKGVNHRAWVFLYERLIREVREIPPPSRLLLPPIGRSWRGSIVRDLRVVAGCRAQGAGNRRRQHAVSIRVNRRCRSHHPLCPGIKQPFSGEIII